MQRTRRRAPLWLMGLSNATYGLVGGFIVLPLPQLLAHEGVPEWKIAAVSAACLFPGFWVFLLGPLLDVRFSRRWYATAFAALAGVGLTAALLERGRLPVLEALLMLSYAAGVLSSNALGGWLATIVRAEDEARLSAWTQVGTFVGNGTMVVLAGEMLRALPLRVAAPLLGAVVVVPVMVFPWMPVDVADPAHDDEAVMNGPPDVGPRMRERFVDLFRDVGRLLRRREVLLTLLLFVAPTGSFALTNLLGGEVREFHATDAFVSRMGGAVLSVAGAASCLLLPVLARWVRALPLYLLIGTAGSVFTLLLLLLPRSPSMFAVAFLGENMVQALSFTAAVAICFHTIGRENPLAATQFSLLTSATVLPIVYMGVLDGRVSTLHGVSGMFVVDGALSLLACGVMAVVMRWGGGRDEGPGARF
jgi:PAT family beta-lactamase induction signal transducer AmpG